MSRTTRREGIIEYIRNSKKASCEELSKLFNVTEETIRKDLASLAESGQIIRTFGGAGRFWRRVHRRWRRKCSAHRRTAPADARLLLYRCPESSEGQYLRWS